MNGLKKFYQEYREAETKLKETLESKDEKAIAECRKEVRNKKL